MAFWHLRLGGCRGLCVSRLDIRMYSRNEACGYLDAGDLCFLSGTAVVYNFEGQMVDCSLILCRDTSGVGVNIQ